MLKLYYSPGSCALASHIALEEAGADYQAQRIDFSKGEQRGPEYLKINPKGRVPALATERGILTENPAVLLYIAQTHPEADLAPLDDAFALARMQSFNSYLCATVHVSHAHKARGTRWADSDEALEAMKAKVPETMTASFKLIDEEMLAGPWVMGENFSVADGYLFTIARWLESDSVDVADFPKVAEHFRRIAERPAVAKVLELH